MMKRFIAVFLSFLLVFSLLVGCGNTPAASTPADKPADSSEPAEEPTEEPTEEHEPYHVDIYTFSSTTSTYIFGVALADLINEHSTWLTATAVESPGSTANELMMRDNPDMRSSTLYYGVADNAYRGTGDWAGNPSTRSKIVFCTGLVLNGLVTADENIKTLEDFEGKTIALRSPIASINYYWNAINDLAVPGIKYENLDFTQGVEALLANRVQGFYLNGFAMNSDLTEWVGNAATQEFYSRATNVNFIDMPVEADATVRNEAGGEFENFYAMVAPIPAGGADERQTEPWYVNISPNLFLADEDMPEEVVYEITRICGEYSDQLVDYNPQFGFVSPETMCLYSYPTEFHPGAMRYYEEKGVEPVSVSDYVAALTE